MPLPGVVLPCRRFRSLPSPPSKVLDRSAKIWKPLNRSTYPEFSLVLDALSQRIDDVESELVLADAEVLESLIASQVCKQGAQGVFVSHRVVLKCQTLKLWQVGHLLSERNYLIIAKFSVANVDFMTT